MDFRPPRWLLVTAAGVTLVSFIAGVALEPRAWANDHPYLVNVLASLTSFGGGVLFVGLAMRTLRNSQMARFARQRRQRLVNESSVSALLARSSVSALLDTGLDLEALIAKSVPTLDVDDDFSRTLGAVKLSSLLVCPTAALLQTGSARGLTESFADAEITAVIDELEQGLSSRAAAEKILSAVNEGSGTFSNAETRHHLLRLHVHSSAKSALLYDQIADWARKTAPRSERAELNARWSSGATQV